MNLDRVEAGRDVPNDINVIIEIPAHSDPVKYEVDKKTGAMFVDRFMSTAMHYPCNYGYIPHTLSKDGDPADVLVVTPYPLISGSVIRCRPVALLKMTDESGDDAKILAVPVSKICNTYRKVQGLEDMPQLLLDQIAHFFEHYKDLEEGKWVRVEGWADAGGQGGDPGQRPALQGRSRAAEVLSQEIGQSPAARTSPCASALFPTATTTAPCWRRRSRTPLRAAPRPSSTAGTWWRPAP
jgi:inorganic pyrophosphatase